MNRPIQVADISAEQLAEVIVRAMLAQHEPVPDRSAYVFGAGVYALFDRLAGPRAEAGQDP